MKTHRLFGADSRRLTLAWTAGSLATLVALFSLHALADGSPSSDAVARFVPYKGTLEKDGVAVEGSVDMVFRLYEDGSSAAAWQETQTVHVSSGQFSVLLGATSATSVADLEQVLTSGDDLALEVALEPDASDEVLLQRRKRFMPVPYALWTTAGTDLAVGDQLVIESANSALLGEALTIRDGDSNRLTATATRIAATGELLINDKSQGALHTGGGLTIEGSALRFPGGSMGDLGNAMRQFETNSLHINVAGTLGGKTVIDSDLSVTGDVTGIDASLGGFSAFVASGAQCCDYQTGNSITCPLGWIYDHTSCSSQTAQQRCYSGVTNGFAYLIDEEGRMACRRQNVNLK